MDKFAERKKFTSCKLVAAAAVAMCLLGSAGFEANAAPAPQVVSAQKATLTISGTVKDSKGEPVIGANVMEKGTNRGIVTDLDGKFTLKVTLTAMNDPANNMGVSSLIWEVRRCRRCELIMDKDYRYWDLVRWHKLDLLDSSVHPNILLGANASTATVKPDMNGNYVDGSFNHVRTFDARQYLYPIPGDQIALTNSAVSQNTPWK